MRLLLDTHVLLWAAFSPARIPMQVHTAMNSPDNQLYLSVASLWEIGIKNALLKPGFIVDANVLRRTALDNGYEELIINSQHVMAINDLPPLHKDPFDRLLIAQAHSEGMLLVTADTWISQYPISTLWGSA